MQIRPARLADLDAIMEIQAACYTAIVPESATSMGAKLAASPDTCRVALAPDGGLLGYLLALPWTAARPPPAGCGSVRAAHGARYPVSA